MNGSWPFLDPRLQGVQEQEARSRLFLSEAQASSCPEDRFRRLMAAVYFARAAVEIMLEAAEGQHLNAYRNPNPKQSRKELEAKISPHLPHYALLEKVRIHDFHRFGVVPQQGEMLYGPVKLQACRGMAAVSLPPNGGLSKVETGGSKVRDQRPLQMRGEDVFDEEEGAWVSLDQALTAYLAALPKVIKEFESLLAS